MTVYSVTDCSVTDRSVTDCCVTSNLLQVSVKIRVVSQLQLKIVGTRKHSKQFTIWFPELVRFRSALTEGAMVDTLCMGPKVSQLQKHFNPLEFRL